MVCHVIKRSTTKKQWKIAKTTNVEVDTKHDFANKLIQ